MEGNENEWIGRQDRALEIIIAGVHVGVENTETLGGYSDWTDKSKLEMKRTDTAIRRAIHGRKWS